MVSGAVETAAKSIGMRKGGKMAEFERYLRQRLDGKLSAAEIDRLTRDIRQQYGGVRVFVGSREDSARAQIDELVRAGVPERTARRKITGR